MGGGLKIFYFDYTRGSMLPISFLRFSLGFLPFTQDIFWQPIPEILDHADAPMKKIVSSQSTLKWRKMEERLNLNINYRWPL